MVKKNTLSALSSDVRENYPHIDELAALRDQAKVRIDSMLSTLQDARDHVGSTQTAVAKKLGVSQATISRWERGEEEISLRDFVFFMQACNEKVALVAAPGNKRFSDEDMARKVVSKLIEQLYPELNLADVFSEPAKKTRPHKYVVTANKRRQQHLDPHSAKQAKAAVQTATSGFWGLGVALESYDKAVE